MTTPAPQRVSLTLKQIRSGPGAELFSICQAATDDGSLTREEIVELVLWIKANRTSDIPAITFLTATLREILADGKVTREERAQLYAAIERVLPPEARRVASGKRREIEGARRLKLRAEQADARKLDQAVQRSLKQEERTRAQEERARRRPVAYANFMIAGIAYEGRADVIRRKVREGDRVHLIREPGNRFSRHATAIHLPGDRHIGYVPETDARELSAILDRGLPHLATVKKVLDGRNYPIPVVVARIYQAGFPVEEIAPKPRSWFRG